MFMTSVSALVQSAGNSTAIPLVLSVSVRRASTEHECCYRILACVCANAKRN
jgi:hypothetical protein